MSYRLETQSSDKGYFLKSILLHVLVYAFVLLGSKDLFKQIFISKNKKLTLIKQSVKVDVVAMPKFTLKELREMERQGSARDQEVNKKAPEEGEKQLAKEGDVLFLKKGKKQSFLEKMKQLSRQKAHEKIKPKRLRKAPKKSGDVLENVSAEQLQKLILAGNKISEGTGLEDGQADGEVSAFALYVERIRVKVKDHWKLPSYLMEEDLTCRIRIYISGRGELIRAEIFESSGNSAYDNKALAAAKSSAPFPSPNRSFRRRVLNGAIVLGFPI